MAIIICPDCGKEISNRAEACPFCGCPIGEGILRVGFRAIFKFIDNCSITVDFEGEKITIKDGYYYDFPVPNDGKDHIAKISCKKDFSILDNCEFSVTLKPGDRKKVTVSYWKHESLSKRWAYHEEFFVVK